LLALLAVSVGAKGAPVGAFATGLGGFISVWGLPIQYATSLAFAAFIDRAGGHATPVPRPACDALRVARRRLPALPQPAHRLADLRRAGHPVDDDGHVGLSVAALRRREPDDGGAVAPAGDGVARVGRAELGLSWAARG